VDYFIRSNRYTYEEKLMNKEEKFLYKLKGRYCRKVRKGIRKLKFNLWIVGAMRGLKWRVEVDDNLDVSMVSYIGDFKVKARRYKNLEGIAYMRYDVYNYVKWLYASQYWSEVKDFIAEEITTKDYLEIMNRQGRN
jgi:hypothetical protein